MRIPILGIAIDERFLNHRLRSTSYAGMAATVLTVALFEYRYFHDHVVSWDLLAVALTFVGVKLAIMCWYLFTA